MNGSCQPATRPWEILSGFARGFAASCGLATAPRAAERRGRGVAGLELLLRAIGLVDDLLQSRRKRGQNQEENSGSRQRRTYPVPDAASVPKLTRGGRRRLAFLRDSVLAPGLQAIVRLVAQLLRLARRKETDRFRRFRFSEVMARDKASLALARERPARLARSDARSSPRGRANKYKSPHMAIAAVYGLRLSNDTSFLNRFKHAILQPLT
jgi:hypothetical protein